MNTFPLNFILHIASLQLTASVRPGVLRLFGEWFVIRRVSEELEFFPSRISEVKEYICRRASNQDI